MENIPPYPVSGTQPMADDNFESAFTDAAQQVAQTPPSAPTEPPAASTAAPVTTPPTPPVQAAEPPAQAATSPAPVAPAQPTLSPFARAAQEAGLPFEGLNDEQIATALAQQIVRTRPYAQYGQQLAPHAEEIRRYFDTQQAPPAVQTPTPPSEPAAWDPEKYFAEKWNVPAWSEKYDYVIQQGMVQRNAETGLFEATPGFESMVMPILSGLNEAQGMTAQQWQGITRGNPYRQFYDVLLEPMRQAWQEDVQQYVGEYYSRQQQEQRINDFENSNATWLYATDPTSGQRVLTSKGQEFYAAIATLREDGVTDPQRLLERAMQLTGRPGASATQAQPSAITPPSAPGAPPVTPPTPVNPQASNQQQQSTFLQNALERASYSPQAGGYMQAAADNPVTVNETDLNNMFLSDFRQARAGQT